MTDKERGYAAVEPQWLGWRQVGGEPHVRPFAWRSPTLATSECNFRTSRYSRAPTHGLNRRRPYLL